MKAEIEESILKNLIEYLLTIMLSVELRKSRGWDSTLEEARQEGALTAAYLAFVALGYSRSPSAKDLGQMIKDSVPRWDMLTFDTIRTPAEQVLGKMFYP